MFILLNLVSYILRSGAVIKEETRKEGGAGEWWHNLFPEMAPAAAALLQYDTAEGARDPQLLGKISVECW